MKTVAITEMGISVPAVIAGCMRIAGLSGTEAADFISTAVGSGITFFDHADIYGSGQSETVFGSALKQHSLIKRQDIIIQSKCGIRKGCYDLSKEYILSSINGILSRLQTDYLDILLLHRPDALVEPEETAAAFEKLHETGKVRFFGVSNHNSLQIQLLQKYTSLPLIFNQLQFSLPVSNMVAAGMEVNMETAGSVNRDGSILDYCRLNGITIQAWSPFQMPAWKGCFIGSPEYPELNRVLQELASAYHATPTQIAAAWILRHPAQMQLVTGTTKPQRLEEIAAATDIRLSREDWYRLYLAAGHILP